MRRTCTFKGLTALALVTLLGNGAANAGGIMLYNFGSPDVGFASAGYAARAQDAATVFTNPAGMSRLEKSQVLGGLQALYGDVAFSPNPLTTVDGSDGGNAIGWMPGGSLFSVHKLNRNLSIGFGLLSYFGLSESFDDDWVGRYYVQESTLTGLTFTPALSYRVNDRLYLGAGLNAMYGYLDSKVAVNNIGDGRPDGQLKYDDDCWGYGANLGILVEPAPGTRLGLTYLSEVKLDFSVRPEFKGLGPGLDTILNRRGLTTSSLDLSMTVPQMVMFSAYHELNEQWAVMANLDWQDWSRFSKVEVQIHTDDPRSLMVDSHYKDTWQVAVGAQYRYSPLWKFSAGVSYDSSAVDDDRRTVTVPMGEVWCMAVGAQYAINPDLTLGAAFAFAWLGDMPVDQQTGPLRGRVSGEFGDSSISFLALNLQWAY